MSTPDPTRLLIEAAHLNDRLTAAGDALVADLGLTSARWQVLGAVVTTGEASTVSDLARTLGLTRQSVQRVANDLVKRGLLRLINNPAHARARLLDLTPKGEQAYTEATRRRQPWAETLAVGLNEDDVRTALRVVKTLNRALINSASEEPSAQSD